MEETLYFAEQLSRRNLTKAEMEKIKELVETYSKNSVQDALEKTFQMTGKLFLEYAEEILKAKAKAKMPDKEQEQIYLLMNGLFKNPKMSIVRVWLDEWNISLLDIVLAYGRMMKNCEKPSFNYMAKVIENKHLEG